MLTGIELFPRIGDGVGLGGIDFAGVPKVSFVGVEALGRGCDEDSICGLGEVF